MVLNGLLMVCGSSGVVSLCTGMVAACLRVVLPCLCMVTCGCGVVTCRCGMVAFSTGVVLTCLYVVSIGTLHELRHLSVVLHGGLVVTFSTGVVCRILRLACLFVSDALLFSGHTVLLVGCASVLGIGTEGFSQNAGLLGLHSC